MELSRASLIIEIGYCEKVDSQLNELKNWDILEYFAFLKFFRYWYYLQPHQIGKVRLCEEAGCMGHE